MRSQLGVKLKIFRTEGRALTYCDNPWCSKKCSSAVQIFTLHNTLSSKKNSWLQFQQKKKTKNKRKLAEATLKESSWPTFDFVSRQHQTLSKWLHNWRHNWGLFVDDGKALYRSGRTTRNNFILFHVCVEDGHAVLSSAVRIFFYIDTAHLD